MTTKFLTQIELAVRWNVSPRTLERWRSENVGPRHLKIGRVVRYRLDDVETFEASLIDDSETPGVSYLGKLLCLPSPDRITAGRPS